MNTAPIVLPGQTALRSRFADRFAGVGGLALLLAFVSHLSAAPVVDTLTGGPAQTNPKFFGYVDGLTHESAQFHTPIGLALDSTGSFLFVADRDNNAIRELDLGGNLTYTFATTGINKPVGVALDGIGNV